MNANFDPFEEDPFDRADRIEQEWVSQFPTAADEIDADCDQVVLDYIQILESSDYVLEAQPNRGPRVVLMNLVNGSILSSATRDNAVTL